MLNNYNTAINFVFKYEGGYSNHPQDPGGPTNYGITLNTARAFWKPDATAADIKVMPKAVAEGIYRKQYADKINFDTIPNGLDLCVLDAAVMSGPSRALKWLTLAKTVDDYQALRLSFYKSLRIWPTFGKGWSNRLTAGTLVAKQLEKNALVVSPLSEPVTPKISTTTKTVGGLVATGGTLATVTSTDWLSWIIGGTVVAVVASYILIKYIQWHRGQTK